MIFDIITIFPDFFRSILEYGLLKQALAGGQAEIRVHDLRAFTDDRHRTVDDRPFGGGPGMVFKPEPIFRATDALRADSAEGIFRVILLSPQGRLLKQAFAEELAGEARIVLICGRYEGVDERVAEYLATDELSIGDYVLSGGELAAAVVMEAVTRLLPGVLGNEESRAHESFTTLAFPGEPTGKARDSRPRAGSVVGEADCMPSQGPSGPRAQPALLDFPQYTRPADFRGWRVPEVLLSGNHEQIRRWRRQQALLKTWKKRPELLKDLVLSEHEQHVLDEAQHEHWPQRLGRSEKGVESSAS